MKIKILHGRKLGKIIKNAYFDDISGFEPGTFRLRDQCATTALFISLIWGRRKVVFINRVHFCQENIEWSGSGVDQNSGMSHLFNLLKIDCAGF